MEENVMTDCPNAESKSICEILTFEELAVTAEWLLEDTLNLSDDFNTKSDFAREQQKQIGENEENVIDLLQNVANLKATLGELEVETKLLSQTLEECSKTVDQMLKFNRQQKYDEIVVSPTENMGTSGRETWLQMLVDTDGAVNNLDNLADELQELKICSEMEQSTHPYKNICEIVECHCETLKNTEKNLNLMMDKIAMIDQYFLEVCQKKATEWS